MFRWPNGVNGVKLVLGERLQRGRCVRLDYLNGINLRR